MKDEPAFPTIKTEIETYEYDDSAGSWGGGTEMRQREVKRYLSGLSKREYFAACVLQGLLSDFVSQGAIAKASLELDENMHETAASLAVGAADALIAELEETK